jgi:bifunctional DNA-binding transcriptional regulator/antitoxin component of YhaV-PrlF toxin-antitoxin module
MNTRIAKCTSKGQITLPAEFRNKFSTDSYKIQFDDRQIIIVPIDLRQLEEEVVFDAATDNNGKGIAVDEMIKLLKKARG